MASSEDEDIKDISPQKESCMPKNSVSHVPCTPSKINQGDLIKGIISLCKFYLSYK